jgi:hypothetical protein
VIPGPDQEDEVLGVEKIPENGSERIIEQIAAQFPQWNVYATRNPDGSPAALMASRRRSLTQAEQAAGLACTLPMGYFGDLRAQLAEQERLERALGGDR